MRNFLFVHSTSICQKNILIKWQMYTCQNKHFLIKPKQPTRKTKERYCSVFRKKFEYNLSQKQKEKGHLAWYPRPVQHYTFWWILRLSFLLDWFENLVKIFFYHHPKCISSWRCNLISVMYRGCTEIASERFYYNFASIHWVCSTNNQAWAFVFYSWCCIEMKLYFAIQIALFLIKNCRIRYPDCIVSCQKLYLLIDRRFGNIRSRFMKTMILYKNNLIVNAIDRWKMQN